MGNLVADWALWAGSKPLGPMDDPAAHPNTPADLAVIAVAPRVGQAVIAGDLIRDEETDGTVTFAQAWNSVGFGDPIMTVTVTGKQIHDALEEQWAPTMRRRTRFLTAGRLRQRPLHLRRRGTGRASGSTPPRC